MAVLRTNDETTAEVPRRALLYVCNLQRRTPIQLLLLPYYYCHYQNCTWPNLPPSLVAPDRASRKPTKGKEGRAYRLRRVKHGRALGNRDFLGHSVQLQLKNTTASRRHKRTVGKIPQRDYLLRMISNTLSGSFLYTCR